jgi:Family of unknown function (DUF6427)
MFIRFFKNNTPSYFFILPLFALVFWIVAFMGVPPLVSSHSSSLFNVMAGYVNAFRFIGTCVSFLLVTTGAFLINLVFNESEILERKTFLPALFYFVFMSNNESMLVFHPAMIANIFIILSIHSMYNAYRKTVAFSQLFDAGMLLSVASVFYFPSIILFPVLIFGLIVFRAYNWREWLITLFGALVPYCFVLTYCFWNDSLLAYWHDKLAYFVYHDRPSFEFTSSFYFLMTMAVIIAFLSLSKLANSVLAGSQKAKKNLIYIIWFFLFSIASLLLAPDLVSPYFSVLAIPFTFFASSYFFTMKKEGWGEILFLLLISAILVNDFAKYF